MPVRQPRRSWRFMLVPGLALLLASSLVACGGSAGDDHQPAAAETEPPTASAAEPPTPKPARPAAETSPADPTPTDADATIMTPDMELGTDAVGTLAAAGTSACLGTDRGIMDGYADIDSEPTYIAPGEISHATVA